jgi:uncharacterized paraquat-inducible protein A
MFSQKEFTKNKKVVDFDVTAYFILSLREEKCKMFNVNAFAMLIFEKLMFHDYSKKTIPEKLPEKSQMWKKKCMNCLRRVGLHHYICPYCRSDNFLYNDT